MPANPDNVDRRVVLSDDYADEKVFIDFYTNSAIRVYRADPDAAYPDDDADAKGQTVWLDNLEKRALRDVLTEELTDE
jgi:hypothetical protein